MSKNFDEFDAFADEFGSAKSASCAGCDCCPDSYTVTIAGLLPPYDVLNGPHVIPGTGEGAICIWDLEGYTPSGVYSRIIIDTAFSGPGGVPSAGIEVLVGLGLGGATAQYIASVPQDHNYCPLGGSYTLNSTFGAPSPPSITASF